MGLNEFCIVRNSPFAISFKILDSSSSSSLSSYSSSIVRLISSLYTSSIINLHRFKIFRCSLSMFILSQRLPCLSFNRVIFLRIVRFSFSQSIHCTRNVDAKQEGLLVTKHCFPFLHNEQRARFLIDHGLNVGD